MSQIQQLGLDLQMTTFLCKASRQKLAHTKEGLTKGSFFILAQTKRKATIQVRILLQVPFSSNPPFVVLRGLCIIWRRLKIL